MKVGRYLMDAELPRATPATRDQLIVREAAQGREVYDERWIRNPVFDRPGQSTTLAYRLRLIESDEQARAVAEKVARILNVHPEWGVLRSRLAT